MLRNGHRNDGRFAFVLSSGPQITEAEIRQAIFSLFFL